MIVVVGVVGVVGVVAVIAVITFMTIVLTFSKCTPVEAVNYADDFDLAFALGQLVCQSCFKG